MNLDLSPTKSALGKCGKFFVTHIYLVLILFLLIDLLILFLFFWQLYLNLDTQTLETPTSLKMDQALLQDFSSQYDTRQVNFDNALSKSYPDPFIGFR